MADFPYVQTSSKTAAVLETIRDRGIPSSLTTRWLEAAGFKSKNDRAFVKTLNFLGLLTHSGEPTEKYTQLKGPDWQEKLADTIRVAYEDIFNDYPQANSLQKPQLIDLFRAKDSQATQRTLDLKVTTFLNLCKAANFSETSMNSAEIYPTNSGNQVDQSVSDQEEVSPLTVNINISLEIPTVSDPAVYDALFSSMAQHLRGLMKGESK